MTPSTGSGRRSLEAVMFADVAGYTALAARHEDRALALVALFQALTRGVVARYGGRIVKFLGDGALVVFDSTDRAARAALALTRAFAGRSEAVGAATQLHVGIHLGEIVTAPDGDTYGDGVNVASRLQSAAEPGQVVVSEDVFRQLDRREDFALEPLGERQLKGVDRPMALYAVTLVPGADDEVPIEPTETPSGQDRRARRRLAGVGLLLALATLSALLYRPFVNREQASSAGDAATADAPIADRSIAVLPFANMSADPENEYFSDGITDDILTALSKIEDLRVISRTSTMSYKDTDKTAREIGDELDVTTILEGSVRRQGDRVRITAQLINADTDAHLWAETYDRDMRDIFEIQTEIAEKIALALQTTLSMAAAEAIAAGRTGDLTAYDLYLKGREHLYDAYRNDMGRDTRRGVEAAGELFQQALEIDPDFARAYAGLSEVYTIRAIRTDPVWGDSARIAAERAIEIDSLVSEGHYALAFHLFQRGRYEEAAARAKVAIEIDPNYSLAIQGMAFALFELGRFDEALTMAKRAVAVDPTDGETYGLVGSIYIELGAFDDAEAWFRRRLRIEPNSGGSHARIGQIAFLEGDLEKAREEIDKAWTLEPMSEPTMVARVLLFLEQENYQAAIPIIQSFVDELAPEYQPLTYLGYALMKNGDEATAQRLFATAETRARERIERTGRARQIVRIYLVQALALQGKIDAANDALQDAYDAGFRSIYRLREPLFDNLRGDPRFESLVDRIEADVTAMRERVIREGT